WWIRPSRYRRRLYRDRLYMLDLASTISHKRPGLDPRSWAPIEAARYHAQLRARYLTGSRFIIRVIQIRRHKRQGIITTNRNVHWWIHPSRYRRRLYRDRLYMLDLASIGRANV